MPTTVCIRRGFCPSCFRGNNAEHARVPHDSPCIDEEQRTCSKLPLLDLSRAGERCQKPRCRQICLVCGNSLAFPCEPDYDEALDAMDQYEEDVLELRKEVLEGMHGLLGSLGESLIKDAERRLQRRLRKLDMAWHPRWRKAVHARCVKKEACGCVLTVHASGCKTHPVKKRPRPRPAPNFLPSMADPEKPQNTPIPASRAELKTASYMRPVVVERCSWLRPSTPTVAVPLAKPALPAPPVQYPKAKPAPAKPNAKLLHASRGCGKIDAWSKGERQESRLPNPSRGRPPFDRARHEREFDPFLHGVFRKNGVELYRFPDGWVEPVPSSVFRITDDGHLVPG